jgi:serine/threonine protein kinase
MALAPTGCFFLDNQTSLPPSISKKEQKLSLRGIRQSQIAQAVKKALGNLASDIEECDKEFGLPLESVVPFITTNIVNLCCKSKEMLFLGGFKQEGEAKRKWKYVVELDRNREIIELSIGRLQAAGSYTNAYYTYNEKVILVAKKKKKQSVVQMEKAFTNTCYLYKAFKRLEESSKEIQELIHCFEFSGNFSEIKDELIQYLPPLPKIILIGSRAISIAPLAKPVEDIFIMPPKTKEEIVERIKILRDVARCVAFCHAIGFIHSDLKPQNMLVYKGIGRMHDIGGAFVMPENVTLEAMLDARKKLVTSLDYSHYQDGQAFSQFLKEANKDSVKKLIEVLRARDVFSLGVSTVEALNGLNHLDGQINEPFQPQAYKQLNEKKVIDGDEFSRKSVTCIKDIVGNDSVDERLQSLLDRALKMSFSQRSSAKQFAKGLDDIYKILSTNH